MAYGYVRDGAVGQVFDTAPDFHPDYTKDVRPLPAGVTTGWRYVDGEYLPPAEPETRGPSLEEQLLALQKQLRSLEEELGITEEST